MKVLKTSLYYTLNATGKMTYKRYETKSPVKGFRSCFDIDKVSLSYDQTGQLTRNAKNCHPVSQSVIQSNNPASQSVIHTNSHTLPLKSVKEPNPIQLCQPLSHFP